MSRIAGGVTRVYADTSVFGGVFDSEFERSTQEFFQQLGEGRFRLVTSVLVRDELSLAPREVQDFFREVCQEAEIVDVTAEALLLQRAYVEAKVLTDKWRADALHVALATVAGCSLILSWNFKHIVHFQKIPLYNAINRLNGYSEMGIYSPLEVIEREEEV